MTHGLINYTAYISCDDTGLLIEHIVRQCEKEGMKRLNAQPAGMREKLLALDFSAWMITIQRGAEDWHAVSTSPWDLLSASSANGSEPRLQSICRSLNTSGFALHISDCGPWGEILFETNGAEIEASGWWADEDQSNGNLYYGVPFSNSEDGRGADREESAPEMGFKLLIELQPLLDDSRDFEKCEVQADTDAECACGHVARTLGKVNDEPWHVWGGLQAQPVPGITCPIQLYFSKEDARA